MLEPRTERSLSLNVRSLPWIVGLLMVLYLFFPNKAWQILLISFGGAWIFGFVWARSLRDNLRLRREMRFGWVQVGDQLEERFTLTYAGWAPVLWAEIIDSSTLPAYEINRVASLGSSNQTQRWRTNGVCRRRGLYRAGPTEVRTSDPLGLFTVSIRYQGFEDILVHPPVFHIPHVQVATGGRAGLGQPKRAALEKIFSSSGTREYFPGDSLRQIHWPLTAHSGTLHVRRLEGVSSSDWWILLDLEAGVHVGNELDGSAEFGVILAASLADKALKAGRQVGLVINGRELHWQTPGAGDQQRSKVLRALALTQPGLSSLRRVLETAAPRIPSASSLIVITPSVTKEWVVALLPLLKRGLAISVMQLEPTSFGGESAPYEIPSMLRAMSIPVHEVTPGFLEQIKSDSPRRGFWEWRISPTGKAIAHRGPEGFGWKILQ